MTDEQFTQLMNKKSPLENVPKWLPVILVLVTAAFAWANLNSAVNNNTREIERISQEISEDIEDVKGLVESQNSRFELYLDSLIRLETQAETADKSLTDKINELEDRIIILER